MENIRERLENRWPFSDTCASQSADMGKEGSAGLRATEARVRSAGSTDRDVSARVGRNQLRC
jgi:hypothetical protein